MATYAFVEIFFSELNFLQLSKSSMQNPMLKKLSPEEPIKSALCERRENPENVCLPESHFLIK